MFAVLYRWKVSKGREKAFQSAWLLLASAIQEIAPMEATLHRDESGIFYAYTTWPSRRDWEKTAEIPAVDETARSVLLDCVEDGLVPVLMESVETLKSSV